MTGNGAGALFQRVEAIAENLRKGGVADAESGGADHTLLAIDEEGRKLQQPFGNYSPDHHQPQNSAFGNQISYLHNEFNFDVARPVGGLALVTHISFVPIYPPRYLEGNAPERAYPTLRPEAISHSLKRRFDDLRKQTVHRLSDAEGEDFIGGKDDIISKVGRFHSYDQPVITTMRSIERLADHVLGHFREPANTPQSAASIRAATANAHLDAEVERRGVSSRLCMLREQWLLMSKCGVSQLRTTWVRHHDHHQTLTAIEHTDPARYLPSRGLGDDDRAAVPTLSTLSDDIRRGTAADAPIDRTAFDSFPKGWADYLFGRYLQGANYLVLPFEWLFEPEHLAKCARNEAWAGTVAEPWFQLCARVMEMHGLHHLCREGIHITAADFRKMWLAARNDPITLRDTAELAMRLLRPLVAKLFNPSESRFEFVMSGAAQGMAIILSDSRNFGQSDARALMSATLIIDLGMNDFERGRLIKHMTEFSTERFLTLATIGTFRFFHAALDVLNQNLGKATNAWVGENGKAARDAGETELDEQFIGALQELTIDLTMLNALVNGGITAQAAAAAASRPQVLKHIEGIGHYPLPGFLSMNDFLERRVFKSIDRIEAVGRRYELLRTRISELSSLVEVRLQIYQDKQQAEQDKNQTQLLEQQGDLLSKVDRLTLFGIVYYAGQIFVYAAMAAVLLYGFLHAYIWQEDQDPEQFKKIESYITYGSYAVLLFVGLTMGINITHDLTREFVDRAPKVWKPRTWALLLAVAAAIVILAILPLSH